MVEIVTRYFSNSALNVGEGDQIKRPPSSATLSLDYNGTKNINSLLSSNKSYVSISSFVNSEDIESLDEQFALQYGASSEISYPMVKSQSKTIHNYPKNHDII